MINKAMSPDGPKLSEGLGAFFARKMLKWIAFGALWIAGLFAGDVLAASGLGGTGSRLVFFGGMWMLACIGAKECIAGYQEAKARRKTPNPNTKG